MTVALERVLSRQIDIKSVIDVGASNGMWTQDLRSYLPHADYLLVEANPLHEPALRDYVENHKNINYALVAAGAKDGSIYFDDSDPFGGVASYVQETDYVELPVRAIDSLITEWKLAPPYLLKLDTHGFEVDIFNGAEDALKQTNLIIVEVYNFNIQENSLLFHEMCDFLSDKGFRMIDLADPLFRLYDNAFWQTDFFFIRSDRPEFLHNSYK